MNNYQKILMIAREAAHAADKINNLSCSLNDSEYQCIKEDTEAFCRQAYELEKTAKNIIPTNRKDNGFDKLLEKNLMGIFAAILIFAGVVLVGMMVLPFFGNYGKMACFFTVSVCMFISGIIFLKKYPDNKFYLSLTGIGSGLLFLLFVMAGTYFNICSYHISCLLIFIWSFILNRLPLFCKWVNRQNNMLFLVIGRTSLYISICFGVFASAGAGKLSILILYLVLMVADYYKTINRNKEKYYSIPCHVLHFLSSAVIVISICIQYKPVLAWYSVMLMVFVCMIIEFIFSINENMKTGLSSVTFHLLAALYPVLCICMLWRIFGSGMVFLLAGYAVCFAVLIILENVQVDNINAARIILFLTMTGVLLTNKITGGLIFIVLIHIAGFYYICFSSKQTKIYSYSVAAATYIWTIFYVLPNISDLYCIISATACLVVYVFAGFDDTDKYAINARYLPFLALLSVVLHSSFHDFGIIRIAGFTVDQHIWLCLLISIKTKQEYPA